MNGIVIVVSYKCDVLFIGDVKQRSCEHYKEQRNYRGDVVCHYLTFDGECRNEIAKIEAEKKI